MTEAHLFLSIEDEKTSFWNSAFQVFSTPGLRCVQFKNWV